MQEPFVSVMVLNYNGKGFLKDCFESLQRQSYPNYEVVLVDNASTDGSVQYVRENFPEVTIIQNKEPLGCAGGRNVGLQYALSTEAEYVALLDNDTKVDPDWLSELVKGIESDPSAGVCGSRTLWMKDPLVLLGGGDFIDILGFPYGSKRDEYERNNVHELFFVGEASMLVKREIIERIAFDAHGFTCGEDRDFCWRVRLMGYRVIVNPKSTLYHHGGGSLSGESWLDGLITPGWGKYKASRERRYLGERDTLRMLLKNYSAITLMWVLPLYFGLLGAEILFFAFIDPRVSLLYLKAILWNIKNLGDTLRLRREVQKMRKVSDRELRKHMYKGIGKIQIFKRVGIPKFGD